MEKEKKNGGNAALKNLTAPIKVGRFELKNRMVLYRAVPGILWGAG
jgi:hypothetical protein